jgi:hypothetical protein
MVINIYTSLWIIGIINSPFHEVLLMSNYNSCRREWEAKQSLETIRRLAGQTPVYRRNLRPQALQWLIRGSEERRGQPQPPVHRSDYRSYACESPSGFAMRIRPSRFHCPHRSLRLRSSLPDPDYTPRTEKQEVLGSFFNTTENNMSKYIFPVITYVFFVSSAV